MTCAISGPCYGGKRGGGGGKGAEGEGLTLALIDTRLWPSTGEASCYTASRPLSIHSLIHTHLDNSRLNLDNEISQVKMIVTLADECGWNIFQH